MQAQRTQSMAFNRRAFLSAGGGALGAAAFAGTAWNSSRAQAALSGRRAPNVVIVLADDLGYGELGSFGQTRIKTPHLDKLAGEGVRYTDFYAGAAVCAPSRCTLLTGMHTGTATVRQNPTGAEDDPFLPDEVTFAHLLQSAGYRTALFGKWGFSPDRPGHYSHPNPQGFDEFLGYLTHIHAHQYYPTYLWRNQERIDIPANLNNARGAYAPDLFAERTLEFIDENKDNPFLVLLSTSVPHAPQHVPDYGQYASESWSDGEKAHAAQITRMDADIGRIVARLQQHGIADDTVLIFLSDNGPHEESSHGNLPFNPDFFDSNGPLRGYKRNIYEGGIRTPAIVWAPGYTGTKAGTEVEEPLAFWDVLPTVADLAGAPVPPFIDGGSIRGTFDDSAPARSEYRPPLPDRALYWWRLEPYSTPRAAQEENGRVRNAAEAVRSGDWKAVRIAPGANRDVADELWDFQLYDLGRDVGEQSDVAAQYPDVAAALLAMMKDSWIPPGTPRERWNPQGLILDAPATLDAGGSAEVTVRFENLSDKPYTRIEMRLEGPDGWQVTAPRRSRAGIRPGREREFVFTLEVPANATGQHQLTAVASFLEDGCDSRTAAVSGGVVAQAPPVPGGTYLSDMEWIVAENAWGPVEKDLSNGRNGAGDGPAISIAGVEYAKGLGVHAPSRITYSLGRRYDRFTSIVGIDDFSANQSANGSVVFQVWSAGEKLYDSGLVTAATSPKSIDIPVGEVDVLELVVTDGGNSNTHDHASWANAMVHAD